MENCAKVLGRNDKQVYRPGTDNMRFADLSLVDWLVSLHIEKRIDLVSVGCLQTLVFTNTKEELVFLSDIEVDSAAQQILMSEIRLDRSKA